MNMKYRLINSSMFSNQNHIKNILLGLRTIHQDMKCHKFYLLKGKSQFSKIHMLFHLSRSNRNCRRIYKCYCLDIHYLHTLLCFSLVLRQPQLQRLSLQLQQQPKTLIFNEKLYRYCNNLYIGLDKQRKCSFSNRSHISKKII